jgi:hypothetical protein
MVHAIHPPSAVTRENDFCVGSGSKVLSPQFLTQLYIVVDFAVEDDPVASQIGHRLCGSGRKIDDTQPAVG